MFPYLNSRDFISVRWASDHGRRSLVSWFVLAAFSSLWSVFDGATGSYEQMGFKRLLPQTGYRWCVGPVLPEPEIKWCSSSLHPHLPPHPLPLPPPRPGSDNRAGDSSLPVNHLGLIMTGWGHDTDVYWFRICIHKSYCTTSAEGLGTIINLVMNRQNKCV